MLRPVIKTCLKQLLAWGPERIQRSLRARTEDILGRAAELGLGAMPSDLRAGHFLGLRFPGGVPQGLTEKLVAEQIYVSVRGRESMRITPHLWVNDEDVARFLKILKKIM